MHLFLDVRGIVLPTPEQFCSPRRVPALTLEQYTMLSQADLSPPIEIDLNQTLEENEMISEAGPSASSST